MSLFLKPKINVNLSLFLCTDIYTIDIYIMSVWMWVSLCICKLLYFENNPTKAIRSCLIALQSTKFLYRIIVITIIIFTRDIGLSDMASKCFYGNFKHLKKQNVKSQLKFCKKKYKQLVRIKILWLGIGTNDLWHNNLNLFHFVQIYFSIIEFSLVNVIFISFAHYLNIRVSSSYYPFTTNNLPNLYDWIIFYQNWIDTLYVFRVSEWTRETRKLENVLMLLHKSDNPFIECFRKFPSNYSLFLFLPSFSFSLHRTWTQLKNTIWNESKYFCCQLSSHLILLPIFTSDSVFILLISYRWCFFNSHSFMMMPQN